MRWSDVGRELTKYFRENVLKPKEEGGIYEERSLKFDVHREMLPMLPKGRFQAFDIKDRPEMAQVVTDPVPMLVGEWSMMGRRGYPVKKPNLPFREMQMIEDVPRLLAPKNYYGIFRNRPAQPKRCMAS